VSWDCELWLLSNLLGTNGGAAVLTEVLMQFSMWEKKKKPLSYWCCLTTFRTEKRSSLKLVKLLVLVLPSIHQESSSLSSSEI
jgi:hypothetical protein